MNIKDEKIVQNIIKETKLHKNEIEVLSYLLELGWTVEGHIWKKGNSKLDAKDISLKVLILKFAEVSLRDLEKIASKLTLEFDKITGICDAMNFDSIELWKEKALELKNGGFNQTDKLIWNGVFIAKRKPNSEEDYYIIRTDSNSFEVKELSAKKEEIAKTFSSTYVNIKGKNYPRYKIYEKAVTYLSECDDIVKSINTPIHMLDPNKISSVMFSHFAKPRVTQNRKDGSYNCKVEVRPFTLPEYISKAIYPFRAQTDKNIGIVAGLSNCKETPCLKYINLQEMKELKGSFSTVSSILSRIRDSKYIKTVMLWCGALLNDKNRHRQVLYLYGYGYDGKSAFIEALAEFMGGSCFAIDKNSESGDKQFFYSCMYGKRLITYGDCKNPQLMKTAWVHSLTGGDSVTMNEKHEKQFSAQLNGKLIVASNEKQQIDTSQANQVTRFIEIPFKRLTDKDMLEAGMGSLDESGNFIRGLNVDGDKFLKDLKKEMPYFLAECLRLYDKEMPNHGEIPVDVTLKKESLGQNSDLVYDVLSEIIESLYEITGNSKDFVKSTELMISIEDELSNDHKSIYRERNIRGKIKDYLERKYRVFYVNKRTDEGVRKVYSGLRPKK